MPQLPSADLANEDAAIAEELRRRFDAKDFSFADERLLHYALRNAGQMAFRLLWVERLLKTNQLDALARYLAGIWVDLTAVDLGMVGALLVVEAVSVCQHGGLAAELDLRALVIGDGRITAAIAAFAAQDPLLPFRPADRDGARKPRFHRLYSFIHQGWDAPPTPFWAEAVGRIVLDAVVTKRPFSLIRLGDGEGNFLRGRTPTLINATAHRTPDHQILIPEVDGPTYGQLRASLLRDLAEADLIGVPNEFMAGIAEDWAEVNKTLAGLDLAGDLVDQPVHYALAEDGCLERVVALQLLSRLPVVFIGPHDPACFTGLSVPFDRVEHWAIPGEAYYLPETLGEQPHYPAVFGAIMGKIEAMPPGTLVLISAGLLGKLYAGAIKRRGGIALDIGAVSDQWAGRTTRIYAQQAGRVSSGHDSLAAMLREG